MPDRDVLKQKIEKRLINRWDGIVKEVKTLHKKGLSHERMEELGLEYRYISRFIRNMYTEKETFALLLTAINQYAKRQYTWFKKYGGIPFKSSENIHIH